MAGLPTDRFYFEGFLPPKQGARRARIAELARIDATLVLFEGGSRIADALHDLAETLGERDGAVCRELTKLHEDIRRAPLRVLAAEAPALETRGEFVIVIAPPAADAGRLSADEIDDILKAAMKTQSVKDAVAHAVELSGRPKREVYARALELAKQSSGPDDEDDDPTADPPREAAPERIAAFRKRPVGREPLRGVADRQGLSHHRAAISLAAPARSTSSPAAAASPLSSRSRRARHWTTRPMRSRRYQQRRIIAAAEAWLATHPQYGNDDLRFDAMLIAPGHLPRHLMAAFDATAIVIAACLPFRKWRWKDRPGSPRLPLRDLPLSLEIR